MDAKFASELLVRKTVQLLDRANLIMENMTIEELEEVENATAMDVKSHVHYLITLRSNYEMVH